MVLCSAGSVGSGVCIYMDLMNFFLCNSAWGEKEKISLIKHAAELLTQTLWIGILEMVFFFFSLKYCFCFIAMISSPMWHVLCPMSAPSGLPAPLLPRSSLPRSLTFTFSFNGCPSLCNDARRCLWHTHRSASHELLSEDLKVLMKSYKDGLLLIRKRRSWLYRRNQSTLHP